MRLLKAILIVVLFALTLNSNASTFSNVSSKYVFIEILTEDVSSFPRSIESYGDADFESVFEIIMHRIEEEPFNLLATIIFLLAIIHTFLGSKITSISHRLQQKHQEKIKLGEKVEGSVSIKA